MGRTRKKPEADLTEFGRRGAILMGTFAFSVMILSGMLSNGNLLMASIHGLAAGLVFGICGMFIGNLVEGYVVQAARREQARLVMERQMRKQSILAAMPQDTEEEETEEGEG